jgi:plastocyanin
MAARKKTSRKAPPKARRKGGPGKGSGAWYDSNWFLLVLGVLVVVGVRVYQVRQTHAPEPEATAESTVDVVDEPPTESAPVPPPTASVAGVVAYRGMLHDEVVVPTVDRRSCPEHVAGTLRVTDGHLADALVWVEGAGGEATAPSDVKLLSRSCQVEPRASVVGAGASLRWINEDDVAHQYEARGVDGEVAFTVDLPPGGEASRTVSVAGVLGLVCLRHPWERASLLVAADGHAAITDVDGRFHLGDVRPGAGDQPATLRVHHPLIDPYEGELDLASGQPLDLSVDLTERAL